MNFEKTIPYEVYQQDAFILAQQHLLGSYLCSRINGKETVGMITELEVYISGTDKASHAWQNKKTPRTQTMFEEGGCAYVFLVYGMYNQFNVVVGPKDVANAILIRSLEPISGIDMMQKRRNITAIRNLTTGPGKLCQAMGITKKEHNGINLCGQEIWLSPKIKNYDYVAVPRIGINYAQEYKDKPWRFYIKDNPFVSKK